MLIASFILYIHILLIFLNFFVSELSHREVENVHCVEKLQVSRKLTCVHKNKHVHFSLFHGKKPKYHSLPDVNTK